MIMAGDYFICSNSFFNVHSDSWYRSQLVLWKIQCLDGEEILYKARG